ncbi:hypothetical protein FYJ77_07285 [Schaalia hyovaginalis]|nr:hypothetical protein [Schaalia hyovaginalis]
MICRCPCSIRRPSSIPPRAPNSRPVTSSPSPNTPGRRGTLLRCGPSSPTSALRARAWRIGWMNCTPRAGGWMELNIRFRKL